MPEEEREDPIVELSPEESLREELIRRLHELRRALEELRGVLPR